jgi:hypothetical protein
MCGQSAWVLFFYEQARRKTIIQHQKFAGLLPLHVLAVTIIFLALAGEALAVNFHGYLQPGWFWLAFNLAMFGLGNYGLAVVLRYEHRRYNAKEYL